jgi:hypothetical protein
VKIKAVALRLEIICGPALHFTHIFFHKAPDPEGKFKLPMQRSKLSGMQ